MSKARIIFLGEKEWGYVALKELVEHPQRYEIVGVFTYPKVDPAAHDWYDAISKIAKDKGLRLYEVPDHEINSEKYIKIIKSLRADILLSIGWRTLFGETILRIPRASVNVHSALLPRYRGYNPNNWSIINDEKKAGVTAHIIVPKVDTGSILVQKEIDIDEKETIADLHKKSIAILPGIIMEALEKIERGEKGTEMDLNNQSYWGRRYPEDGLIDWSKSVKEINNIIRALSHPYPGAFTFWNGKRLYVWKAEPSQLKNYHGRAGQILMRSIKEKAIHVRCGDGMLKILRVQEEGGEELDAADCIKETGFSLGMRIEMEIEKIWKKIGASGEVR